MCSLTLAQNFTGYGEYKWGTNHNTIKGIKCKKSNLYSFKFCETEISSLTEQIDSRGWVFSKDGLMLVQNTYSQSFIRNNGDKILLEDLKEKYGEPKVSIENIPVKIVVSNENLQGITYRNEKDVFYNNRRTTYEWKDTVGKIELNLIDGICDENCSSNFKNLIKEGNSIYYFATPAMIGMSRVSYDEFQKEKEQEERKILTSTIGILENSRSLYLNFISIKLNEMYKDYVLNYIFNEIWGLKSYNYSFEAFEEEMLKKFPAYQKVKSQVSYEKNQWKGRNCLPDTIGIKFFGTKGESIDICWKGDNTDGFIGFPELKYISYPLFALGFNQYDKYVKPSDVIDFLKINGVKGKERKTTKSIEMEVTYNLLNNITIPLEDLIKITDYEYKNAIFMEVKPVVDIDKKLDLIIKKALDLEVERILKSVNDGELPFGTIGDYERLWISVRDGIKLAIDPRFEKAVELWIKDSIKKLKTKSIPAYVVEQQKRKAIVEISEKYSFLRVEPIEPKAKQGLY
jgi:hypothetical protein